jgi:hypothetical protein
VCGGSAVWRRAWLGGRKFGLPLNASDRCHNYAFLARPRPQAASIISYFLPHCLATRPAVPVLQLRRKQPAQIALILPLLSLVSCNLTRYCSNLGLFDAPNQGTNSKLSYMTQAIVSASQELCWHFLTKHNRESRRKR